MSREIKFRAWDKVNKCWLLQLNPQGAPISNHFINFDGYVWSRSNINGGSQDSYSQNEIELMQYTGLKDKNGKEIYEGDILRFTEVDEDSAFEREETHTGVVEWINEISQWRFVYPSGQRRELHLVTDFESVYKCAVLGNIYENPELLSSDNK